MKTSHSLSRAETGNPTYLVYEDAPPYDPWLKLTLGGILALTLILGIMLLSIDLLGAWIMFGATAFDALLFYTVLPKRYQVFRDRVKIVLGRPFAIDIPLFTIREARPAPGSKAFVYWGIRLATSSRNVVEIVRSRGLNIVISPANRDAFLEHLGQVLEATPDSKSRVN